MNFSAATPNAQTHHAPPRCHLERSGRSNGLPPGGRWHGLSVTEGECVTFGTVKCHFPKNIITRSPPPLRGAPSRREPMVTYARRVGVALIRIFCNMCRSCIQKIRLFVQDDSAGRGILRYHLFFADSRGACTCKETRAPSRRADACPYI